MEINVRSRKIDKTLVRKIDSLGRYVIERMIEDEGIKAFLEVDVRFNSDMGNLGEVDLTFDDDFGQSEQSYLTVELNRNMIHEEDTILKTVAHEFVHVSQYATGRYRQYDSGEYWLGKKISSNKPYRERPEEVEAFSKQGPLFGAWRQTNSAKHLMENKVKICLDTCASL
jgi:hypothetical protein